MREAELEQLVVERRFCRAVVAAARLAHDDGDALPVKVLFTEPQYSPVAAQTIASETGAKMYELDPVVTGEANEEAMDAYITAMKKNMEVLKEALQ